MPTLSPTEIYQICLEAGFSPDDAVTWTAIAMAESGGNTGAHNPVGEDSQGLWQINVNPAVRENHWGDLSDPRVNARAAFEISSGGEHMAPWTVTHDSNRGTNRDYRNFLDDASAASGGQYHGDNRGVTGYGGDPGAPGADPNGVGQFASGGLDAPDAPDDGEAAALQTFLDSARAQAGDPYVWASEADSGDENPDAFDCSELVQWAAGRAGIEVPDGSWLQYLEMNERGGEMTVEEALNTPGALLFSFSSEPSATSGRPSSAHVAISLGDGTTIEARGRTWGVGEWEAGDRFTHAAVIPGLATSLPPPAPEIPLPPVDTDLDDDLLDDTLEMSIGTDPSLADTDGDGLLDGFEVAIGTDALKVDTDADGLSDAYEMARSQTNPLAADTDSDGTSDSLEISAGTDAVEGVQFTLGTGTAPGAFGLGVEADTDADGLSDRARGGARLERQPGRHRQRRADRRARVHCRHRPLQGRHRQRRTQRLLRAVLRDRPAQPRYRPRWSLRRRRARCRHRPGAVLVRAGPAAGRRRWRRRRGGPARAGGNGDGVRGGHGRRRRARTLEPPDPRRP